jgi:hypothetical protein
VYGAIFAFPCSESYPVPQKRTIPVIIEATDLPMDFSPFLQHLRNKILIVGVSTSVTSTDVLDSNRLSSLFFTAQNATGSIVSFVSCSLNNGIS